MAHEFSLMQMRLKKNKRWYGSNDGMNNLLTQYDYSVRVAQCFHVSLPEHVCKKKTDLSQFGSGKPLKLTILRHSQSWE